MQLSFFFFLYELIFGYKKRTIENIKNYKIEISSKKFILKDIENYVNIAIESLISEKSQKFFILLTLRLPRRNHMFRSERHGSVIFKAYNGKIIIN